MNCALLVQGYTGANWRIALLAEFYRRSGLDCYGVGREDGGTVWPDFFKGTTNIGPNGYIDDGKLPEFMVGSFEWFLGDGRFAGYESVCLIEHDAVFVRPMPELNMDHPRANLSGGPVPPRLAREFFHCPYVLTRAQATRFVKMGNQLLAAGERECGSPDFFFGLVWERLNETVRHIPEAFSRNSLDIPSDRVMARDGIRSGEIFFVHGVKSKGQLDEMLS